MYLISCDSINLDLTFTCGQCFRWNKIKNVWIGIINNSIVEVYQNDINSFYVNTNLTKDYIEKYFDIKTNYIENISKWNILPFEKDIINKNFGLRILKQELFETTISFILSQQSNIPKIKKDVNNFSQKFGKKLSYNLYSFPNLQTIKNITINDLNDLHYGYRSKFIISAINLFNDVEYLLSLCQTDDEIINTLKLINGIGDKVANCIGLFSLHRMNLFPIDIWMKRILNKYYNNHINLMRFNEFSGLIQQFLFNNERNFVNK